MMKNSPFFLALFSQGDNRESGMKRRIPVCRLMFHTIFMFQVPHDVAVLLKLRYEGGIAYVDGICGRNAVGVSGVRD